MMIQATQDSFARERALLLLRQVGSVARAVLASAPRTLIAPRVFVLDGNDPTAAALLEHLPPDKWLGGLVSEHGVSVFTLDFRDAYHALSQFDPRLIHAVDNFNADEAPCLVVTEGAYAFLPLSLSPRSAPLPLSAVN